MIGLIKSKIKWICKYLIKWLYVQLDIEQVLLEKHGKILAQQRQQMTYLSQRVYALNKPVVDAQSRNFHYPTLDELIYEYKLFKRDITIKPSQTTLSLELVGHGLETDYRYVGQANHRLYMKVVSPLDESVWYNCSEAVQAIGLVEKDGCYNIRHDKKTKSTPYQRTCYIPSPKIHGECTVYLRFGKKIGDDIDCEDIKVVF